MDIHAGRKDGAWATVRARKVLRSALQQTSHGKCAYCESRLGASAYPQVDHYVAKSIAPERAFQWTNLFPSCQICNTKKGDQEHGGSLLKPDIEDPEAFLSVDLNTGELTPRDGLDVESIRRVRETARICDLQRGPLRENRWQITLRIKQWLDRASKYEGPLPRDLAEEWQGSL